MKRTSSILAALYLTILLLAVYVGSYLALTEKGKFGGGSVFVEITLRKCPYSWMKTVFLPMAKVEAFVDGKHVTLTVRKRIP